MSRLLFASLNLPELDCEKIVKALMRLPEKAWGYDSYRHTYMAPMLTRKGEVERKHIRNLNLDENFLWTEFAPQSLRDYFEKYIFNWMQPIPRIMILKTGPQSANHEHIDCEKNVFGPPHYKFRYVLQGNTSDLYFITRNNHLYAPDVHKPFIMDGGWPHGMRNRCSQVKYTLCAGAPWEGAGSDWLHGPEKVFISNNELPEQYEDYFERSL